MREEREEYVSDRDFFEREREEECAAAEHDAEMEAREYQAEQADLDGRNYGAVKNCGGCRYWSEMIAKAEGSGVVAMCLHSSNKNEYRPSRATCRHWKSGKYGAIDSPGGNPYQRGKLE